MSMTIKQVKTFFLCLDQVAEVLNTTLSSTRKEGYWLALQDLSLDAFQAGCIAVMREEHFFPAPVVFREYARAWQTQQRAFAPPSDTQQLLTLREALVSPEDIRQLIAAVWPGDAYPHAYAD